MSLLRSSYSLPSPAFRGSSLELDAVGRQMPQTNPPNTLLLDDPVEPKPSTAELGNVQKLTRFSLDWNLTVCGANVAPGAHDTPKKIVAGKHLNQVRYMKNESIFCNTFGIMNRRDSP